VTRTPHKCSAANKKIADIAGYLEWDESFISRVLTDGFERMKTQYIGGKTIG
jgi:hypothetical protein